MTSHRAPGRARWERPRLWPTLFFLVLMLLLVASEVGWLPFWARFGVYAAVVVDLLVWERRRVLRGGLPRERLMPRLDPDYRRRR